MTYNASRPFVMGDRTLEKQARDLILKLENQLPIVGSGSPEGVVKAPLYAVYLDKNGSAGSIQYRKMQASIGGDATKGWVGV